MRIGPVVLKAGEMLLVPLAVEHRPVGEKTRRSLLTEPAGTINADDSGGKSGKRGLADRKGAPGIY